MDITKLKSFIILSECRSFSKTAEILFCSQPAVSKHIDSLENELQVPLFNRIRNNISLTIQGEHFKQYAKEIVRIYENSKEHIKQIENLNEGTLHFGATNFIGVYLVPELIAEFQAKHPKIKLNTVISSSNKLFEKLENHEIEFVFLSHYVEIDKKKFISKSFFTDQLVLVVSNDHRLANKSSCKLIEIKDETFISKDSHSSLYRFLDDEVHEFNFNNRLVINNQEAIKQTVMQGVGVSIMSRISVELEIKLGLMKAIEIEDYNLTREINLVYERKKHITPAGQAFFKLLDFE